MYTSIIIIFLTFIFEFKSLPIDNLVKYTPYTFETNLLTTRINQVIRKFDQMTFNGNKLSGAIVDFNLTNIVSNSLNLTENLSFNRPIQQPDNQTVCMSVINQNFGLINFVLEWSYITVLNFKINGKAVLGMAINNFTSCITYSINDSRFPIRKYIIKTSFNTDNITIDSSDFGSTNAKENINDMLKKGLLDNITNQIDSTFSESLNLIEIESTSNFKYNSSMNFTQLQRSLFYNKSVINYDLSSYSNGYLTNYDLKFIDVNSSKPYNEYQRSFSNLANNSEYILNTNFLIWAINILTEKKIGISLTSNETSFIIEDLGAILISNYLIKIDIVSKHKYSERVIYSISMVNYSNLIMRNKVLEGNSIVNVTFYAEESNETLLSCEFQVEFFGTVGLNIQEGSIILFLRDISVINNIDSVKYDETKYILDYKQLKGLLRSMIKSYSEREFATFKVLDEDKSEIKAISLDEPYGIIFN